MKRRYSPGSPARRLGTLAPPASAPPTTSEQKTKSLENLQKVAGQQVFFPKEEDDEYDDIFPQPRPDRVMNIRAKLHQIARDLSGTAHTLADFAKELGQLQMSEAPSAAPPQRPIIPTERSTVTVEEAATILGISRNTTYQMVQKGEIKAKRFGKRWVVPVEGLRELLEG